MDLLKESGAKFRYYASGRRHVEGCMVTLDLRPRQDLLMGYIVNALMPQDDIIDFEVSLAHPAYLRTRHIVSAWRNLHGFCFSVPGRPSTLQVPVKPAWQLRRVSQLERYLLC